MAQRKRRRRRSFGALGTSEAGHKLRSATVSFEEAVSQSARGKCRPAFKWLSEGLEYYGAGMELDARLGDENQMPEVKDEAVKLYRSRCVTGK